MTCPALFQRPFVKEAQVKLLGRKLEVVKAVLSMLNVGIDGSTSALQTEGDGHLRCPEEAA